MLATALGPRAVTAQDSLDGALMPHGSIEITSAGKPVATVSLNGHGAEWKHAPQTEATAEASKTEDGAGTVVHGTLPVPNTDEGAIRFVETIVPRAQGPSADYFVGVTGALPLNGLQVSVLLPASMYAGKSITVHPVSGKPDEQQAGAEAKAEPIIISAQLDATKWQPYSGTASKVEIAAGTSDAITIVPRAFEPTQDGTPEPPVFSVQDLRKWDQDVIEVRLALITEDNGRWLSAWDKLHAAVDISFARAVRWP